MARAGCGAMAMARPSTAAARQKAGARDLLRPEPAAPGRGLNSSWQHNVWRPNIEASHSVPGWQLPAQRTRPGDLNAVEGAAQFWTQLRVATSGVVDRGRLSPGGGGRSRCG